MSPDHTPNPRPAEATRTCPSCGADFTPDPTTRQTYCAPACRPSHQKPELVLAVKNCPECRDDFTCHPSIRQLYCSPRCRKDAELRRELHRDQERAARLGETPRPRPAPAPRTDLPDLQADAASTAKRARPVGVHRDPQLPTLRPADHHRRPAGHPRGRPPGHHQPHPGHHPAAEDPVIDLLSQGRLDDLVARHHSDGVTD